MRQYLDLLADVIENGVDRPTRGKLRDGSTPGSRSVFGRQLRFDLNRGFPLVTTKRVNFHHVAAELFWFLSGSTSVKPLQEAGVHIWDQWADGNGELGPVYGAQWRAWRQYESGGQSVTEVAPVDQIAGVIERIKRDPHDRRLVVSAWNVADIPHMRLPPCHCLFQFYVAGWQLSCQMYQRSADLLLGVPYNIASYALLTHLVAHACDLRVGEFVHTIGDAHVYLHHVDAVREQLAREPRALPTVSIEDDAPRDIDLLREAHVALWNYDPHPAIRVEVAV